MHGVRSSSTSILFLSLFAFFAGQADAGACAPDAVPVGTVCVDQYEGSVWSIPSPTTKNKGLVTKLQNGTVSLADLKAAGAVQLGCDHHELFPDHTAFPTNFPANGNWTAISPSTPRTPGVYAASVPGV